MVLSTTVCRRIRRKAPCAFLKRTLKQKKPRLSLEKRCDLLKLAEESRTNACESKSGVIKKDHVQAAAKVILKKSRG